MSVPPSGRLSLPSLAWRHLVLARDSSAALALSVLLALLPAGLLLIESSGARVDLGDILAASSGVRVQRAGIAGVGAFDAFQGQARNLVEPRLGRYVDDGSERATAAPYRLASISSLPPQPPADMTDVEVAYAADLRARVVVVQGLLPKTGTQGGETTATMPQVMADRAGARLFDQVCLRAPAASPSDPAPWCARIVGIWRPASTADARWTAHDAPIQLFVARDSYFALVGLKPAPQRTEAARLYRPVPGVVAPQDTVTLADGVRKVRAAAARVGQVQTSLDADLARYSATGSHLGLPLEMVTAALVPLLLLLVWVAARWYVDPRLHELALLRARGWAAGHVLRLVLVQFAVLAAAALAAALLGVLGLAWRPGLGPLDSTPGELLATVVAAGALVVTAVRFFGLAEWASRQNVVRLGRLAAATPGAAAWRGARLNSLLALPAVLLLLLSRVAGVESARLPGALGDLTAVVVGVAGLVMLVMAALPALSLAAEALGAQRTDVEGTLARWQLRRWWQRYAGTGFLIVFAFAIAAFAAVGLAEQELDRPALGAVVLGQGVAAGMALGFTVALAAALLAYGLVFLVACRSRADDYTALLVDGLPAAALRRSLRMEQHVVLAGSLLVGLALGLVLAWATSWGAAVSAPTPAGAVVGLVATAAAGILGGATVAWLVRRGAIGFSLVERGRAT